MRDADHNQRKIDGRKIDLDAGRRAFLRASGVAAAGLATFGATSFRADLAKADITDIDILNFALNLEYLEAEFYLRAAFGRGLKPQDITGTGTTGDVDGGTKVNFPTDAFKKYAVEIAQDEEAHVQFLRSALGSMAVARPEINLRTSFTAAARAAGLIGNNDQFDPFANETNFLLAAFIFEDVGVTAYKGAAPLITDKGILEAAAGILAAEAYHAGLIRTVLFSLGLIAPTNAISDARDALDLNGNKDQGLTQGGNVNVIPLDKNGLAFSRDTTEVLRIVYLDAATNPKPARRSFFPNGLNGTIA